MKTQKSLLVGIIVDSLEVFVAALALFIIVYMFIASPHVVVGTSMMPNFIDGEYVLTDNISYRFTTPQRGDVIVLQYDPSEEFIKRVIGLPGDTVRLTEGHVYINGEELNENAYLSSSILTEGNTFLQNNETMTVPKGDYFVLGDNREVSKDSRIIGWVAKSSINGRVILIYYPLSKMEIVPKISYTNTGNMLVSKL